MKVTYRTKDGQFTTQLESETETGLVEQLVDFQNLLEKNTVCGSCKSPEVFWNIRENDAGKYFEKKCNKCFATMPYHVNKDKVKKGGLYFSYKDKWAKYDPSVKKTEDDAKVFTEEKPAAKGKK